MFPADCRNHTSSSTTKLSAFFSIHTYGYESIQTPGQLAPGQLPLNNCHPDNCHLGQLPPRTIATQDICPQTTATQDNCKQGNCHPDNWPLRQLPPRKLPPSLTLHLCATLTTATCDNAFYASHTTYQILFGTSRCGTHRRSRGTAVENLCAPKLLLQRSSANVSGNEAVAAV